MLRNFMGGIENTPYFKSHFLSYCVCNNFVLVILIILRNCMGGIENTPYFKSLDQRSLDLIHISLEIVSLP